MPYYKSILKALLCILFSIFVPALAMFFNLDPICEACIIIAIAAIPVISINWFVGIELNYMNEPIDTNRPYLKHYFQDMNSDFIFRACYALGSLFLLIYSWYIYYVKYGTTPTNYYVAGTIELIIFKYIFWIIIFQFIAVLRSLCIVYLRTSSTYTWWWILFPLHVILYPVNILLDRMALNKEKSLRFIYFEGEKYSSYLASKNDTEYRKETKNYTSWEKTKETIHAHGYYDGSPVDLTYEGSCYVPVEKTRTSYVGHDYRVDGQRYTYTGTCLSVTTRKVLKYRISGFIETGKREYKN